MKRKCYVCFGEPVSKDRLVHLIYLEVMVS